MNSIETVYWNDPALYSVVEDEQDLDVDDVEIMSLLDMSDLEKPEDWSEEAWAQLLPELLPQTDKDMAEHSVMYFAQAYLAEHLGNACSPAHYEAAKVMQDKKKCKRVLWLFPREHAKTTWFTFIFVLWCVCYNKKSNIVICSDSRTQAQEFLRNIKNELVTNSKILEDFGDLQGRTKPAPGQQAGKWDEQHVITANGVQIKIWSPNSQVRGLQFNRIKEVINEYGTKVRVSEIVRPDLVILDDILNDQHVRNKEIRDYLDKWFFSAVFNAVDSNRGDIYIVGTLLHYDDFLSRLMKDTERTVGWIKRKTPACEIGDDGIPRNVLWPARWPAEKLLERRQQIGSLAFSKEFLLNPREEDAAFFNNEWFRFYADHTVPTDWLVALHKDTGIMGLPSDLLIITAIDPNTKDKEKADYTVIATVGFSPSTRNYYVIDVTRERPSPEQQVMEMIRHALKWGRQYREDGGGFWHQGFVIETIAYQHSIRYWLKKYAQQYGITDAKYYERSETGVDKVVRCSVMSPMAEQNRLFFPLGVRTNAMTGEKHYYHPFLWLEEELDDFPMGSYDDGVDALQRCYSVLIREERKYAVQGRYGPAGEDGFLQMVQANKTLKRYLNEKGM